MWLAAAVLNNAVYGTFPLQKVLSDSVGQGFALSVSEARMRKMPQVAFHSL